VSSGQASGPSPRPGRTEKAILGLAVVFRARRVRGVDGAPRRRRLGAPRAEAILRCHGRTADAALLATPRLDQRVRVVVVRDEAAASFYDSRATVDSTVESWRAALSNIGAEVRVVGSAELRATMEWASVMVVPSSPCLTVATREAMEAASAPRPGVDRRRCNRRARRRVPQIGYGLWLRSPRRRASSRWSRGRWST